MGVSGLLLTVAYGVPLGRGDHQVELRYRPERWRTPLFALSLAALGLLAWIGKWRAGRGARATADAA